jgi:hypothetical protein
LCRFCFPFAAKIDDSGHQDEDEDEDRHFHRPDKKMRRLLEIGDQLSMSLYNIKWSTTLIRTAKGFKNPHALPQGMAALETTDFLRTARRAKLIGTLWESST